MKSTFKTKFMQIIKTMAMPVLMYLLFTILSGGRFGPVVTLLAILRNMVLSALTAWGMMYIISAGMFDLSLGAVAATAAMAGGSLSQALGLGLPGLVVITIIAAVLMCGFTAFIYSLLRLPSMVVSIGLVLIYETCTSLFFAGKAISITSSLTVLTTMPYNFIVLLIAMLLMFFIWNYTRIGNHIRAVGSNQQIAGNIGINVWMTKIKAYLLAGVFIGLAGVILISKNATLDPESNMSSVTIVFNAIMAVFIGTYLSKYSNMIIGVLIGAFTIEMLASGLLAIELASSLQNVALGFFLLIFISFSTNQQRIIKHFESRKKAKVFNLEYEQKLRMTATGK